MKVYLGTLKTFCKLNVEKRLCEKLYFNKQHIGKHSLEHTKILLM